MVKRSYPRDHSVNWLGSYLCPTVDRWFDPPWKSIEPAANS